jgi:hypothetical protein
MLERSIRHAWKAKRASDTEPVRIVSTRVARKYGVRGVNVHALKP